MKLTKELVETCDNPAELREFLLQAIEQIASLELDNTKLRNTIQSACDDVSNMTTYGPAVTGEYGLFPSSPNNYWRGRAKETSCYLKSDVKKLAEKLQQSL